MLQKALSILLGHTLFLATAACSYPGISADFGPQHIPTEAEAATQEYNSVTLVDPPNVKFTPGPISAHARRRCNEALKAANKWYRYFHMKGLRMHLACGLPDAFRADTSGRYYYHGANEIHPNGPWVLIWINNEAPPFGVDEKQPEEIVIHEFIHVVSWFAYASGDEAIQEFVVSRIADLVYYRRHRVEE